MKIFFKKNTGYTIIETMISVSLFLVIVTISVGALLNANLVHRKSQDMRSILDNLSFVMEDISRNLRTGYNYHCFRGGDFIPVFTSPLVSSPNSCGDDQGGWAVAFEFPNGSTTNHDDQGVYVIDSTGKILKSTQGPYSSSNFIQLTPDEIVIDPSASGFSVLGAESSLFFDEQQPLINIRLVGKIVYKNIDTPFSIQTSMSQRLVDI